MARSRIRRASLAGVALGLVAASTLMPMRAAASGGGGCGQPVTDAAGTTVEIEDYCFSPTILRVAPGTDVVFVNRDRAPHSVLGANAAWGGYERVRRAVGTTFGFAEAGVYPYVCTYHIGMVGVVVVGDGVGGAIDTSTAAGPVIGASSAGTDAELAAATAPEATDADRTLWLSVWVAISASVVVVAGFVVRRHRRRVATLAM